MAATPMGDGRRHATLGWFYLMGTKVFLDVFTFGFTTFDVLLFSFDVGAPLPSHICGFHVYSGWSDRSRVMFDLSFDRLKMTPIASSGWMLQYHFL
ncbi:hypothetical protein D8674_013813 [Pyrus ussuriensis x Pyrus communis]|uniref:Uncharacterized protein n=1 Tax=Pyrus ussuriensis x Pyrus communis TaxID=2448454 RepID=A0A5N5H494_9ROSA|nr:hypothetical protein D8674_013813 [Pyrus ussuriensis x Pyrus communis]